MAQVHKSVLKRERTNKIRNLRNRSVKARLKTLAKGVEAAVASGNKQEAEKELRETVSAVDKACKRRIISENTAGRRKSRLMRLVNKRSLEPLAVEEPGPESETEEASSFQR